MRAESFTALAIFSLCASLGCARAQVVRNIYQSSESTQELQVTESFFSADARIRAGLDLSRLKLTSIKYESTQFATWREIFHKKGLPFRSEGSTESDYCEWLYDAAGLEASETCENVKRVWQRSSNEWTQTITGNEDAKREITLKNGLITRLKDTYGQTTEVFEWDYDAQGRMQEARGINKSATYDWDKKTVTFRHRMEFPPESFETWHELKWVNEYDTRCYLSQDRLAEFCGPRLISPWIPASVVDELPIYDGMLFTENISSNIPVSVTVRAFQGGVDIVRASGSDMMRVVAHWNAQNRVVFTAFFLGEVPGEFCQWKYDISGTMPIEKLCLPSAQERTRWFYGEE